MTNGGGWSRRATIMATKRRGSCRRDGWGRRTRRARPSSRDRRRPSRCRHRAAADERGVLRGPDADLRRAHLAGHHRHQQAGRERCGRCFGAATTCCTCTSQTRCWRRFYPAAGDSEAAIADVFADRRTLRDPAIERLAHGLVHAGDVGDVFGPKYVDSICVAMVARLLDLHTAAASRAPKQAVSALAKWRLKRATDYVEQHLAEPIGLAELAASTGLSRMHFAAQFRAATGMRPHEYLVWRRIERAMIVAAQTAASRCARWRWTSASRRRRISRRSSNGSSGKTPNEWRHQNADPRPEISSRTANAVPHHLPWDAARPDHAPIRHAA